MQDLVDRYRHLIDTKKQIIKNIYNEISNNREHWINKNRYYYKQLINILKSNIEPNKKIIQIGCGIGQIIAALNPQSGIGIDISEGMISKAKEKFPQVRFMVNDVENLKDINETFDYVLLVNVIGDLIDIQRAFANIKKIITPKTRIIIIYYNYLWEPLVKLAELLKLKIKQPIQNWLSITDIENLLSLSGYEVVKKDHHILFPKYIPLLSWFLNKIVARLPVINKLCFVNLIVAKQIVYRTNYKDYSCSIVMPCKNEKENIEAAICRIPKMGKRTEIIFVDDKSTDGTDKEIERLIKAYPEKDIKLVYGPGKGKAKAVWAGFEKATGDIFMILDGDLTVMPEELSLFFNALVEGKGEFINGCRLVYEMEKGAMRLFNILGNKFFGFVFSYLLSHRIKDTLCGTKAFFRDDYLRMRKYFGYFGDYDRWGDYNLLFSAAKLNLKIIEVPVHYVERIFGQTKMTKRLKHGWMMLRMCMIAAKRLKFLY